MKVTVDVRTLMTNLEALNPHADLTLVKVYLFDLAMGRSGEPVVGEQVTETEEDLGSEPVRSENQETTSSSTTPLVDSIVGKSAAQPSLNKGTSVVHTNGSSKPKKVTFSAGGSSPKAPASGRLSRDEKLAKRAEYAVLSSKSTKELLAEESVKHERPRGENGQVIDEGVEAPVSPGELELG